jgi:hypothetical protein
MLKWIFEKWDLEAWRGLIWLRIGTGTGEFVIELLGSIQYWEFWQFEATFSFSGRLLHHASYYYYCYYYHYYLLQLSCHSVAVPQRLNHYATPCPIIYQ